MIQFSSRIFKPIMLLCSGLVLTYAAFTFADEMETNEGEQAIQNVAVTADVDSLYALIQTRFVGLEPIWKRACYDCHTDKTVYPWYYKLPIVKGMIDEDITEARAELDMSNGFPFVSGRTPADDLRKLGGEVKEGAMPPGKYTFMHWSAKLSQADKDTISTFVSGSLEILAAHGITPTPRPQRPEEK